MSARAEAEHEQEQGAAHDQPRQRRAVVRRATETQPRPRSPRQARATQEQGAQVNAQQQPKLTDNRALLASIGHRRVRTVAAEISPYAEALYGVVCERKPVGVAWQHDEW